jgi:predicted nucleic-acid-binding protein
MTALDTNVLVRVITNDDRAQAARAARFLREQDRVFIAKTVLLELEWVLRSAYRINSNAIIAALRNLLDVSNVEIEDEVEVALAIEWFEKGMDFADGLHVASADRVRNGVTNFATFDNSLRRKLQRFGVIELADI